MTSVAKLITKKMIKDATGPNAIIFSDKILYKVCKDAPKHRDDDIIKGKIMMIGRIYSASIERTKKSHNLPKGTEFFRDVVVPDIKESRIDHIIAEAQNTRRVNLDTAHVFIKAHYELTKLFSKISGKCNRSLASKYIHFHAPEKFFIFDRFAKIGINQFDFDLKTKINAAKKSLGKVSFDLDYLKHFVACLHFKDEIKRYHKKNLTPREIDNLLMALGRGTAK